MKKILYFFIVFAYLVAAIGCTGYLFYFHKPLFAVGTLLLAILAYPKVKEVFGKLVE